MPPHHRCFVDPGVHAHDPAAIPTSAAAAPTIVGTLRPESVGEIADKGKGRELEPREHGAESLSASEAGRRLQADSAATTAAGDAEDRRRAGTSEQDAIGLDSSVGADHLVPARPTFTPPPPIWSPTATTPPLIIGGSPPASPALGPSAGPSFMGEINPLDPTIAPGHPLHDLAPPIVPDPSAHHSVSPISPRPRLAQQHSAPHVPTMRGVRSASPADPPSRHLDPDHHWLSEDEAGSQRSSDRRPHTLTRRRSDVASPRGDADDDSKSPSPRAPERPPLAPHHPIHHRPAPVLSTSPVPPPAPENGVATPPLAILVHTLIAELICPACKRLLHDPTTLACGHTSCMSCAQPRALHVLPPGAHLTPPATESQFARNPSTPMARSTSGSLFSTIISLGTTPAPSPVPTGSSMRVPIRGKLICPHPTCTRKDRSATLLEPKIDFLVQKVLALLCRDVEGVDRFVEQAEVDDGDVEMDAEPEAEDEESINSTGSASSGGGEDPTNDDSKRTHKARRGWATSKRVRRTVIAPELDLSTVSASFVAELQSELECQVCVQLFYEPITSPCGHTFCQRCLARALDHSDKCPLCRTDFPSFSYFQAQPPNVTIARVILAAWPTFASDRKAALEAEEKSSTLDTPIFVCTLAWPSLPTYIHIFEPRYRLMMRRVMDGDRKFGMVLPSRDGGAHEFGTMLHVRSCNMMEDGRSIVETIGTYRFRLLEKGTFDGYTVGRIERVDDVSQEQEDELERLALARNPPQPTRRHSTTSPSTAAAATPIELSTADLMGVCLQFVTTLRSGSAPWVLQRLNNTIGPMPTDPSDFSFWMAEVMPVDDHVKAALLQITSPRERLRLIVFWIEQFRSSWWFSRGCSIM